MGYYECSCGRDHSSQESIYSIWGGMENTFTGEWIELSLHAYRDSDAKKLRRELEKFVADNVRHERGQWKFDRNHPRWADIFLFEHPGEGFKFRFPRMSLAKKEINRLKEISMWSPPRIDCGGTMQLCH